MPFPGGTGSRIAAVQWASAEHPEQAKDFGDTLQDVFLATTQEKMPALQQFFLYTISLMATTSSSPGGGGGGGGRKSLATQVAEQEQLVKDLTAAKAVVAQAAGENGEGGDGATQKGKRAERLHLSWTKSCSTSVTTLAMWRGSMGQK